MPALSSRLWTLLLLAVVCLPRISLDIYLPALPAIARTLHASDAQMHATLTLYMLGYAASMLVSGPLCDRFGRRPVLIGGVTIFLAGTLMCSLATRPEWLITARLFQALGGCCGTVIGRVIVRDHFAPPQQVRLLSLLSMGMAVSPMIAPIIGSLIGTWLGWRWIFTAVAAIALPVVVLISLRLPETRPAPQPRPALFTLYRQLLRERYFLRYSLVIGCVYCTYFPFIADSSTVLQRTLHLSPLAYAWVFALTVAGYAAGSYLFRRLSRRHAADALIAGALLLNIAATTLLVVTTHVWPNALPALIGPLLWIMVSVGLVIPACQIAVLQPYAHVAGAASGLFFFIQMAMTAVCSHAVGRLSDGTLGPMVGVTAVASVAGVLAWYLTQVRAMVGEPEKSGCASRK